MSRSNVMAAALEQAAVVLEHGPDAVPMSLQARSLGAGAIEWLGKQTGASVSRKASQEIFDHSSTRQIEVELAGEVESFLDGSMRKISVKSIARRLIALALLSHPLDGEPAKARQPAKRYQKRPRERTAAELEGLRKGNEQRAREARKRREAASA